MLNSEAISEVLKGTWHSTVASVLTWMIYAAIGSLFVVAAWLDAKRQRLISWSDEYFLVETIEEVQRIQDDKEEAVVELEAGKTASEKKAEEAMKEGLVICGGCASVGACLGNSDAFKEALDDIVSSWCEWFSQVRSILESLTEGLDFSSGADGLFMVMGRHLTSHMLHLSAARGTGFATGFSADVVSFVMDDPALVTFLMQERDKIRERDPEKPPTPAVQRNAGWSKPKTQMEAWTLLYDEVSNQMLEQTRSTAKNAGRTVLHILLSNNPISEIFLFDVFVSCKKKVLSFAVDLLGALTLSCVFFQASGMVRGKSNKVSLDCGDGESGVGQMIGRFMVIALASLFFAGLPVIILESLQTKSLKWVKGKRDSRAWKKQLKVWQIQDVLFWIVGLAYLAFCTLFMVVFLANIGNEDSNEWFTAGWVTLLQDLILLPLAMALVIPLFTRGMLAIHTRHAHIDTDTAIRNACEQLFNNSNLMLPIVQA